MNYFLRRNDFINKPLKSVTKKDDACSKEATKH